MFTAALTAGWREWRLSMSLILFCLCSFPPPFSAFKVDLFQIPTMNTARSKLRFLKLPVNKAILV